MFYGTWSDVSERFLYSQTYNLSLDHLWWLDLIDSSQILWINFNQISKTPNILSVTEYLWWCSKVGISTHKLLSFVSLIKVDLLEIQSIILQPHFSSITLTTKISGIDNNLFYLLSSINSFFSKVSNYSKDNKPVKTNTIE